MGPCEATGSEKTLMESMERTDRICRMDGTGRTIDE